VGEDAYANLPRLGFQHKNVRNSILLQDLLGANPLSSPQGSAVGHSRTRQALLGVFS
jgi:hypothetical protein